MQRIPGIDLEVKNAKGWAPRHVSSSAHVTALLQKFEEGILPREWCRAFRNFDKGLYGEVKGCSDDASDWEMVGRW